MHCLLTHSVHRLAWLPIAVVVAMPAQAARHGGIEIGAKGVKATAVDVTGDADAYDIKVLLAGTENTTLTAGLAKSRRFGPDALKTTAAAVATFADTMQKEHRIPTENLYVVGSSGLFSALAGDTGAIKANGDALAAAIRDACGLKMTFISVEREAELSIDGVVPAKHAGVSLLLDIGSGNTKGGFRDGDHGVVSFGIPYGSVTFSDAAKKRAEGESYAEKLAALRQEVLVPGIKKALQAKPALAHRERVYLGGGAVWAMAAFVRPGGHEPYLVVTSDDVAAYHALLLKSPGEFPKPDLTALASDKERTAATKEMERVKKTFTPEQLLAGAEILKGLSDEFSFKERKVYFARNAYLGWILAYISEKARPANR